MKTNGATWKAYLDSWPDCQWFDDSDETYDGHEPSEINPDPDDAAVVAFTCGVVYMTREDREGKSLVSHFNKWLKAQTHTNVMCQVPKDKLEQFESSLKGLGGKLVK